MSAISPMGRMPVDACLERLADGGPLRRIGFRAEQSRVMLDIETSAESRKSEARMAWDNGLDLASVAYKIAAADERRVRVIAGPGTGKSFAMKRRVARLLESGADPITILAVTFTRVAADDLHRELQSLGTPGCDRLEGQTLHSLAMKILRRKSVLEAMGRSPRPLNRFEMKSLLCDLSGKHVASSNAVSTLEATRPLGRRARVRRQALLRTPLRNSSRTT